jgi:hypothetical protein
MTQTDAETEESGQSYSTPWNQIAGAMRRILQTACALAPIILVLLGVHPLIAVIPALYPWFILLRRGLKRLSRKPNRAASPGESAIRVLFALFPVVVAATSGGLSMLGWISAILVAVLPLAEPLLTRVAPGRRLRVANLPGIEPTRPLRIPLSVPLVAHLLVILVATIVALAGAFGLDAFARVRSTVRADNNLYAAIEHYAPRFILYYGVPTGTEYQVAMWIKYLERIGEPFIVVLRRTSTFNKITAMTDAPVVVRTTMRQLDDVVVPGVTTAFYVNNGAYNVHLVRYPQLTHVQLLHGDSDKATSFNPITGMFDKIFVAGQAGIDRYESNGIIIPKDKFTIVGRPQVEDVQQQGPENLPVRTVLYAPTWEGHYADTNYGSLPVGPAIIEALLERGCTVIFRPHPYSYKNPEARENIRRIHELLAADAEANGRAHLFGAGAESELDVFGCFNAADAMISDVSSVVPDFLYSGKPYALVTMTFTVEEFTDAFPLARAAYVIRRDLANLSEQLDELLVSDAKAQQRRSTREYYLGPFPPETYAEGFLGASRELVLRYRKPAAVLAQRAAEKAAKEMVSEEPGQTDAIPE